MAQSPREIVQRCLKFEYPDRLPSEMWVLPGITAQHPEEVKDMQNRFISDFACPENVYRLSPKTKGDPWKLGTYVDRWGCEFVSIQAGIIGEIKNPILKDLGDWQKITPPLDTLPEDFATARDKINRFCQQTDKYTRASAGIHPWERYQFIRGTYNAMMDIATQPDEMPSLLKVIHEFYLRELEFWVTTDVDSIVVAMTGVRKNNC